MLAKVSLGIVVVAGLVLFSQASGIGQTSNDVARGEAIFENKGNCLSCHRVADHGSHLGPDLSAIGSTRKREDLHKAIVTPSSTVQPQNRLYRVVTRDGKTLTGRLLNQDIATVQILTSTDKLLALKKSDLREYDFTDTPPMPSYSDKLSPEELTDLVAYLVTLKGVVKQ